MGPPNSTLIAMSSQPQYPTAPARIHAFIECPHCGRIPKPTGEILVALGSDSPDHVHCHFRCERCGSEKALLYLEREIVSRH